MDGVILCSLIIKGKRCSNEWFSGWMICGLEVRALGEDEDGMCDGRINLWMCWWICLKEMERQLLA